MEALKGLIGGRIEASYIVPTNNSPPTPTLVLVRLYKEKEGRSEAFIKME